MVYTRWSAENVGRKSENFAVRNSFHWGKPQSEQDARRAAAYEWALQMALTEVSASVAQALARPEALLPYWGRLGFLRVMATIPDEQIDAQRLDRFACVLLKDPVFNARSIRYEDHGLVGLNFALEPIVTSRANLVDLTQSIRG